MFSLRLAVVSVLVASSVACGSGYGSSPASPSPTPSTPAPPGTTSSSVTIPVGAEALRNRAFMPDELDVAAGTTVTWVNTDSTTHTSTSNASGWNSGNIAPGSSFSLAFQNAGTFQYHCAIHPGMVGTVVVR